METATDFESRIERLDLHLFDAIRTQSVEGDRRSWLALQRAIRRVKGAYTYLEIGSHLGGSLQQHLLDPRCQHIISIDNRPLVQPDDLWQMVPYDGNSTERMLRNLRELAPQAVSKVLCFDSDARDIDPARLPRPADLCFIDGEHTRAAVVSDFEFCLRVSAPQAVICFHDDDVIYAGILEIERSLHRRRLPFVSLKLQGLTYAIGLSDSSVLADLRRQGLGTSGWRWLLRRRLRAGKDRYLPKFLHPAVEYVGSLVR